MNRRFGAPVIDVTQALNDRSVIRHVVVDKVRHKGDIGICSQQLQEQLIAHIVPISVAEVSEKAWVEYGSKQRVNLAHNFEFFVKCQTDVVGASTRQHTDNFVAMG